LKKESDLIMKSKDDEEENLKKDMVNDVFEATLDLDFSSCHTGLVEINGKLAINNFCNYLNGLPTPP
jgi:hypothetical protein